MILGFCGFSGAGKTTMIAELVRELEPKYSVAVVKHTPHKIDIEGKDSKIFRDSGAKEVVLLGEEEVTIRKPRTPYQILKSLEQYYDIVFVEGFKNEKYIHKVCLGPADCEGCILRNPEKDEVLEYVTQELGVERILKELPNFNCGECGHKNCEEMARAIYSGKDKFENCRYWNPNALVAVKVNGKDIYMGKFAQDVVVNTISGLMASFKGVKTIKTIEIKIKNK